MVGLTRPRNRREGARFYADNLSSSTFGGHRESNRRTDSLEGIVHAERLKSATVVSARPWASWLHQARAIG